MADDYHQPGIAAFQGYVPILYCIIPSSVHDLFPETPASDPVPRALRTTCETCRLLHRTCRGGSPTKPCDGCVKRKAICVFKPLGSLVKKRNRKRKHDPTTGEEPEAVPKKVAKNGTVHAPGFDPLALGLRIRCNYCHLRKRSCINGSSTTPCDNCKQKNVFCEFGPRKSIVDTETFRTITDEDQSRGHNLRKTTDEGQTQEHNLRQLTDENYTHEHNLGKISGENYYHEYDNVAFARLFDSKEQNYTQEHGLRQLTNGVYTQETTLTSTTRTRPHMRITIMSTTMLHLLAHSTSRSRTTLNSTTTPNSTTTLNSTTIITSTTTITSTTMLHLLVYSTSRSSSRWRLNKTKLDISSSQEDLRVPDEHLMHPLETLAARGKLVYDLEGLQCESSKEVDEE
ncbi:hypothetical protein KCU91_g53, partial [Aureobasidium melanogenum]